MRLRLARCGLAALAYATLVFAAGCVIGTLRVMVVPPRVGSTLAVVMELPLILGISWYAARLSCRLLAAPNAVDAGLIGAYRGHGPSCCQPRSYVRLEGLISTGPLIIVFFRHGNGSWEVFPPLPEAPAMCARLFACQRKNSATTHRVLDERREHTVLVDAAGVRGRPALRL